MADAKPSKHPQESGSLTSLSEIETMQLLEEALRQYEAYIRLADMPAYPEDLPDEEPIYSWDNPIGLVILEKPHPK